MTHSSTPRYSRTDFYYGVDLRANDVDMHCADAHAPTQTPGKQRAPARGVGDPSYACPHI